MAAERLRLVTREGINVEIQRSLLDFPLGLGVRILHGNYIPELELARRDEITNFDRATFLFSEGLRNEETWGHFDDSFSWVTWEERLIPCGSLIVAMNHCSIYPFKRFEKNPLGFTHSVSIEIYAPGNNIAFFSISILGCFNPKTQKLSFVRSVIADPHRWLANFYEQPKHV